MHRVKLQLLCLFGLIVRGVASCSMTDDTCQFWLEIEHSLTMMDNNMAVYPFNGMLYHFNVTNVTDATPVNVNKVITADGWEKPRMIITANKSMPGPPIEVYEGQTIIVHVKNLMSSSAVTVHWHGLHQQGTPWMDGVAFVTQCPILSGQSFTYKFKAYPRGTFWYHAHIGSQLSMGLFGALIVREKVPPPMQEFIMMVQDWNHDYDADMIHLKMLYGNYENRVKLAASQSLEGAFFSMFPLSSGLINGKGRYFYPNGTHNQAPLTVYVVEKGQSYRFRMIGAGNLYPFRVSIDDHFIKLLASDGFEIQPVVVESFIINPGERFDFELTANNSLGNYWIRAETLEINVQNHVALAILRYQGAPIEEPTTVRRGCTKDLRCLVVNCPFSYYPEDTFTDCRQFDGLKAMTGGNTPGTEKMYPEEIEDIFLNFAFPGTTWTPAAVNGITFQPPTVSALTQPQEVDTQCDPSKCGEEKVCRCSHSISLQHNKVYQFVFLNMGSGKGWAHPIHMHGHSFYVVKLGYPQYNQTTGKFVEDNLDIACNGHLDRRKSFCNSARWASESWGGNNIPGLELEQPVRKDTIMVPTGGYVVVRIRADNPGLWIMHCHIELHNSDGMALVLNESFPYHKPPPSGFPRCGSFHYDSTTSDSQDTQETKQDQGDYTKSTFWIVVGCLITIIVILCVAILVMCYRHKASLSMKHSVNGERLNLGFAQNS